MRRLGKRATKSPKSMKIIFPSFLDYKLFSARKLTQEKSSTPTPGQGLGQGNKRKPSFGDWPEDWASQELSFHTEFTEENTGQLQLEGEQEKSEYFK